MSLLSRLKAIAATRKPDFIVGRPGDPYLKRWWLIPRNRFFNIYLHRFLRSDDDRALHDHMYFNLSILLEGQYTEHTIAQGGVSRHVTRCAGDWKFRSPWTAHRIEVEEPVLTLFITGPRMRNWGFHCPKGWVCWQDFVDHTDAGNVGRGCEQ